MPLIERPNVYKCGQVLLHFINCNRNEGWIVIALLYADVSPDSLFSFVLIQSSCLKIPAPFVHYSIITQNAEQYWFFNETLGKAGSCPFAPTAKRGGSAVVFNFSLGMKISLFWWLLISDSVSAGTRFVLLMWLISGQKCLLFTHEQFGVICITRHQNHWHLIHIAIDIWFFI